jgi:hypothetical protein
MTKIKATNDSRKITFGKKRSGKSKNMNSPKRKNVSKYRGQGR